MTVFEAVVVGVFQGVAEFFPISSSAHAVLIPWLFGWEEPPAMLLLFARLGTLTAVFGFFIGDWFRYMRAGITSVIERRVGFERDRMIFWYLVFGSIPPMLSLFALGDYTAAHFRAPLLLAVSLASAGFILYWVDGKYAALRGGDDLGMKDAVNMGIAQAIAVIPGISRTGAALTMGRLVGFNREAATRFTLLLSLPVLSCMAFLQYLNLADTGTLVPTAQLVAGFFSAAFSGFITIAVMLRWSQTEDFSVFAWYRIFLATLIVIWSLLFGV